MIEQIWVKSMKKLKLYLGPNIFVTIEVQSASPKSDSKRLGYEDNIGHCSDLEKLWKKFKFQLKEF